VNKNIRGPSPTEALWSSTSFNLLMNKVPGGVPWSKLGKCWKCLFNWTFRKQTNKQTNHFVKLGWSSDWAPGGRQGQARAAQVDAMQLSGQKGWSQDPPLPSLHLRAGSGGEGFFCWRSLPAWGLLKVSKQLFFLHFCICICCIWALSSFPAAKGFVTLLLLQCFCPVMLLR